jgi:predicted metal-binding transcription factor (methanogenesis marker protein 9)
MKDNKMVKLLAQKISPLKKDILSFESQEKVGVLILDKKEKNANSIISKIYLEAGNLIKAHKRDNVEVNDFIKEAMKEVLFGGNVGVVLVQKDRIVIRGDFNHETTEELISAIFREQKNLNEYIYDSTTEYMTKKINIEFLGADKLFNTPALYKIWIDRLITLLKKDSEYINAIKSTSIKIGELSSTSTKSYEKIKVVVGEILKTALSDIDSQFYHSTADFLLKNIAKANSTTLKYAKEFFDTTLKKGKSLKRLNFALIRRNMTDREKHLVFIQDAKAKIKEAKDKEFEFVRIAEEADKRMKALEKEIKVAMASLDEAQAKTKETFDAREVIRKEPKGMGTPEYKKLSEELRQYNSQKSKFDVEVKNLHQKYDLAKQTIENATDDRADYVKLLPEMISVQDKKILDHEGMLKEFEEDYQDAKAMVIEALVICKKLKN